MPSHSRSRRHHTSRKKIGLRIQDRKKTQPTPSTPWAPAELDAMLGYGTSSSFPLFTTGIVSRFKKFFGGKKRAK